MTNFYEVAVRHHNWPYAWYGLGLSKLALYRSGAREVRSPHQPAGSGWLAGAATAFESALRAEANFAPAVLGLAETVLESSERPENSRALATLRRFASLHDPAPPIALALCRLSFAEDSFAAARRYGERFLAAGGDSAIGHWELARIAFAADEPATGIQNYFLAVAEAKRPEAIDLIRANLALIADSAELAAFDGLPIAQREGWVRHFWSEREVADGRPAGSRLPEHFRRERVARKLFRYSGTTPQYEFVQIFRGAPRGLDDRGVIYVRHGPPDDHATYIGGPATSPNESWIYFRPDGNLIFHFARLRVTGFRLIEDLSTLPVDSNAPFQALAELFATRADFSPLYERLAWEYESLAAMARVGLGGRRAVPPELLSRERQAIRADVAVGTTTDSDPLDLDRTWQPIVQVFGTVDPRSDATGLLVVVALPAPPGADVIPLPGGAAGYILHLRATAADDRGVVTLDADTLQRLRTPHPLRGQESLTLVQHFSLPTGQQRVRIIVADSTETRGAVRIVSAIPVVGLRGDSLSVSDLITGREGSGVEWHRPDGHIVALQPNNAWRPSDVLTVAFDVGGLQPGSPYRIRIGIADLGADSTTPPKASIQFENQASGTREFVTQSLNLRTLRPGRYLLTATITSGDSMIRRERRITVAAAR